MVPRWFRGDSEKRNRCPSLLYEQGLEPPDIARETGHSLKDYERVKLLLKRGMAAEEIGGLIGRGKRVVLEYVEIARQYHPELFAGAD